MKEYQLRRSSKYGEALGSIKHVCTFELAKQ